MTVDTDRPGFRRTRLETRDGRLVAQVFVALMEPMPEGVMWGQRFFTRSGPAVYREGLLWICPPGTTIEKAP